MASENKVSPLRGEIWSVDFSPSVGSEIKDIHPALVMSVDEINSSTWGLIVVCPISSFRKNKPFRLHILLDPPEGGIKHSSIIRCEQVKSVSVQRFLNRWGQVSDNSLNKVTDILAKVLGLQ